MAVNLCKQSFRDVVSEPTPTGTKSRKMSGSVNNLKNNNDVQKKLELHDITKAEHQGTLSDNVASGGVRAILWKNYGGGDSGAISEKSESSENSEDSKKGQYSDVSIDEEVHDGEKKDAVSKLESIQLEVNDFLKDSITHGGKNHCRSSCVHVLNEYGPRILEDERQIGLNISSRLFLNETDLKDFQNESKMITDTSLVVLLFSMLTKFNVSQSSHKTRVGILHSQMMDYVFGRKNPEDQTKWIIEPQGPRAIWDHSLFFTSSENVPRRVIFPLCKSNHFVLVAFEQSSNGDVDIFIFDSSSGSNSNLFSDENFKFIAQNIFSDAKTILIHKVPAQNTTMQRIGSVDCGFCLLQNARAFLDCPNTGFSYQRFNRYKWSPKKAADSRKTYFTLLKGWLRDHNICVQETKSASPPTAASIDSERIQEKSIGKETKDRERDEQKKKNPNELEMTLQKTTAEATDPVSNKSPVTTANQLARKSYSTTVKNSMKKMVNTTAKTDFLKKPESTDKIERGDAKNKVELTNDMSSKSEIIEDQKNELDRLGFHQPSSLTSFDRQVFSRPNRHMGKTHSMVCCYETLTSLGPRLADYEKTMGMKISPFFYFDERNLKNFQKKIISVNALFIIMFGRINENNQLISKRDVYGLVHPTAIAEMFRNNKLKVEQFWLRTAFFLIEQEYRPRRIIIPIFRHGRYALLLLERHSKKLESGENFCRVHATIFDSVNYGRSHSMISDTEICALANIIYDYQERPYIYRVCQAHTTNQMGIDGSTEFYSALCLLQNMRAIFKCPVARNRTFYYAKHILKPDQIINSQRECFAFLEKWIQERTKCADSTTEFDLMFTQLEKKYPQSSERFLKEEEGVTHLQLKPIERKLKVRQTEPVEFEDNIYYIRFPSEFGNPSNSTRYKDFLYFLEAEVTDIFDSSCWNYKATMAKEPVTFQRQSYQYNALQTVRLVIHDEYITIMDPFLNPKEDNEIDVTVGREGQPIPFERQLLGESRRYVAEGKNAFSESHYQYMEYVAEVLFSEGYLCVQKLLKPIRRIAGNELVSFCDVKKHYYIPRRRRCRSLPPFASRDITRQESEDGKGESVRSEKQRKDYGASDEKEPKANDREGNYKTAVTDVETQKNTPIDETAATTRDSDSMANSNSSLLVPKATTQKKKYWKEEETHKDRMKIASSESTNHRESVQSEKLPEQAVKAPLSTFSSNTNGSKATIPVSSLLSPLHAHDFVPNLAQKMKAEKGECQSPTSESGAKSDAKAETESTSATPVKLPTKPEKKKNTPAKTPKKGKKAKPQKNAVKRNLEIDEETERMMEENRQANEEFKADIEIMEKAFIRYKAVIIPAMFPQFAFQTNVTIFTPFEKSMISRGNSISHPEIFTDEEVQQHLDFCENRLRSHSDCNSVDWKKFRSNYEAFVDNCNDTCLVDFFASTMMQRKRTESEMLTMELEFFERARQFANTESTLEFQDTIVISPSALLQEDHRTHLERFLNFVLRLHTQPELYKSGTSTNLVEQYLGQSAIFINKREKMTKDEADQLLTQQMSRWNPNDEKTHNRRKLFTYLIDTHSFIILSVIQWYRALLERGEGNATGYLLEVLFGVQQ